MNVKPVLLTGAVIGKARQYALQRLASGDARVVVGTHALIQETVEFAALGLVVIDEQHRFGVEQRRRLRDAGLASDALVMSATPIPRSLALVLYGDLDVSVIKHSPPGRGAVVTRWVGRHDRPRAYEFIRERLRARKQAYFVYPRIAATEQE